MAEDNTFLNADNIYQEVEGEAGKNLNIPEDQQRNLIGIIQGRFAQAEDARQTDENRWLRAYENYSCLLYTSPSPRDAHESRMPSSA